MAHPGSDDGEPEERRWVSWRSLIYAALAAVVIWFVVDHQTQQSRSNADKTACEVRYGAGMCVRSNGQWVPVGSYP